MPRQFLFRDDCSTSSDDSDDSSETRHHCYDVLIWEESAVEEQQQYYTMFGDRDYNAFKPNERLFLRRQVGFALFGPPPEKATSENMYTGYNTTQMKTLNSVLVTIESCQGSRHETQLATIFVCLKIEDMPMISVPVFRIPKFIGSQMIDDVMFVDSCCRVYNGWDQFLQENQLPACKYCYPVKGEYNGDMHDRVLVEFGETPAAQLVGRVMSGVDTASNLVSLTAAGVIIASLAIPVTARALVAATFGGVVSGLYGIGRSIGALADRHQHRQDISLSHTESRSCWLSMLGGVLGVGSGAAMQAVSSLAREGVAIGTIGAAAVTTLNVASLVTNGAGLINNLNYLIERKASGELTKLEVFQFSVSLFFFTHSILNFQTASAVIKESQKCARINRFKKSLGSNCLQRQLSRTGKQITSAISNAEKNTKIVKGLEQISNKDTFFARMARGRKEFPNCRPKFSVTEKGKIRINDQVTNRPVMFRSMSTHHRRVVLDFTKALSKGDITRTRFHRDVNPIFNSYKLEFSNARAQTITNLCRSFGVRSLNNIVIGGSRIFKDVRNVDVDLLDSMLQCFGFTEMLELTRTVADKLKCSDIKEFIKIEQFLLNRISDLLSEMESAYQSALNDAASDDANFDKEPFDDIYGIVGERLEYFLKVIFSMFKLSHNLEQLLEEYSHFKTADVLSSRETPFIIAGTYFGFRDFYLNGDMSEEEILFITGEVLGFEVDSANSEVMGDENVIFVFCFGEDIPTRTVMIETDREEGTFTAKEL